MIVVSATLSILIALLGCENVDDSENGTLNVKLRTWNNYGENTPKSSMRGSHNLDLIDVRTHKYEMKFTTDEIRAGILDSDINWVTAYTSNEMMLDSERDFHFELPAGSYQGFALLQGNDFFWIGTNGNQSVEIPDSNQGSSDKVYNVFGLNGLFMADTNGILVKVLNNEKIDTKFTIVEGQEHTLTVRMNFEKIGWHDNDENGSWSDGDSFDSPTLPAGVETMADFIFD